MSLLIRIEPDLDESLRACNAIVVETLPRSFAGAITIGIYALVGLVAFVTLADDAIVAVILAVGGVMATLLALQLEARVRGRRALAADAHAKEPHFVEITPEGVRAYCAHVDSRITWDGISRVVETGEFYLFLRGASGGPAIPKRALNDAEDTELRQVIRHWSPDGGRGLAGEMGPGLRVQAT